VTSQLAGSMRSRTRKGKCQVKVAPLAMTAQKMGPRREGQVRVCVGGCIPLKAPKVKVCNFL
jgi:hypothetical protein